MNLIKKILLDTLTKDGKFCKDNIQMLVCFIISIIIAFIIIGQETSNTFAFDIFLAFLSASCGMAILSVWDKLKSNNNSKPEQP